MSTYHLRARHFVGPLHAPGRDERCDVDGEDLKVLVQLATRLSQQGYRVWLYVHGRAGLPGACDLVLRRSWLPAVVSTRAVCASTRR